LRLGGLTGTEVLALVLAANASQLFKAWRICYELTFGGPLGPNCNLDPYAFIVWSAASGSLPFFIDFREAASVTIDTQAKNKLDFTVALNQTVGVPHFRTYEGILEVLNK
jgi:hypothetical protein